jgi:hypothetical protein
MYDTAGQSEQPFVVIERLDLLRSKEGEMSGWGQIKLSTLTKTERAVAMFGSHEIETFHSRQGDNTSLLLLSYISHYFHPIPSRS